MPRKLVRPERAKALFTAAITLLPLQGVIAFTSQPQGVALGYVLLGFAFPFGQPFTPTTIRNYLGTQISVDG